MLGWNHNLWSGNGVKIGNCPTSGQRIELCRAEAVKLCCCRTEFNMDRNYGLPARTLNIICLGGILNFRSEHAILLGKVSASGRRIEMHLGEARNLLVGGQNSTLLATIIFRPDDYILHAWQKFGTSCHSMQFFLGKLQLPAGELDLSFRLSEHSSRTTQLHHG
jgi:hypothetical protein